MVLNGAGGWENRKTLATNAKMRRREGKEGREAVGKKPIAGRRHRKPTSPPKKTPNHRHIRQDTKPQPQTNQPKSRRPIPYYLGHKAMWLSDLATRPSDFAIGRSDFATLPYGRDNTVLATSKQLIICLAAPSVDSNLVVCGLANYHSEKIANPKPLRKVTRCAK
jgi:hypothetical protein